MKDITYGQFVCTIRPEKKEPNRTRLVVCDDRINYPGDVATPTTDMLAAKILFNSVISTVGARFMTMDISNFYLNTPLKHPEYIRMKINDIPAEIVTEYKLQDLIILLIVPFRTIHPSVPQFYPVPFCSVGSTFLIPNILILIH